MSLESKDILRGILIVPLKDSLKNNRVRYIKETVHKFVPSLLYDKLVRDYVCGHIHFCLVHINGLFFLAVR